MACFIRPAKRGTHNEQIADDYLTISAMPPTARPRYDPESLEKRASGRIGELPRRLGIETSALRSARVLEIGCGNGECTAAIIDRFGADAYGIDIVPRWEGGPYASLGVSRRCG
jgi:SAM-dependent methyltransferase